VGRYSTGNTIADATHCIQSLNGSDR
jgi:hypothetical protein